MNTQILSYIKSHIIDGAGSKAKRAGFQTFWSASQYVVTKNKDDIRIIIGVIIKAMSDNESLIKISACETLYNILNSCRSNIISEICPIFDSIIRVQINNYSQCNS